MEKFPDSEDSGPRKTTGAASTLLLLSFASSWNQLLQPKTYYSSLEELSRPV